MSFNCDSNCLLLAYLVGCEHLMVILKGGGGFFFLVCENRFFHVLSKVHLISLMFPLYSCTPFIHVIVLQLVRDSVPVADVRSAAGNGSGKALA